MDGDKAAAASRAQPNHDQIWTSREGTPLRSLPGIRVEPALGEVALPSFLVSAPQPESTDTWHLRPDYDPEAAGYGPHSASDLSDVDSISSSTGELFRTVVVPVPSQPTKKKCSLSPTPSFTYIDARAAAAARKRAVTCCASKSVLKITLTFCASFLLGMVLTVIYMEVFLWRQR